MSFCLDIDVMRNTFKIPGNGLGIKHNSNKNFKLFPFTTSGSVIESLESTIGAYMRIMLCLKDTPLEIPTLKQRITQELNVAPEDLVVFNEVIDSLFFSNGSIRPTNLKMFTYISGGDIAEKHLAYYLASVLSPKEEVMKIIREADERESLSGNVLEGLMQRALPRMKDDNESKDEYFPITHVSDTVFLDDLQYILENSNRTKEYLVELLEYYYFFYTSQTCLQLDRFLEGDRSDLVPLYFSLDWEKTNRARKCYTDGWKRLEKSIWQIFVHANVLEILNQRKSEDRYDYISIGQMISADPSLDSIIASQIYPLTEAYRMAITDCGEMRDLCRSDGESDVAEAEIRFLFNSIKTQFSFSDSRHGVDQKYSNKFRAFCSNKFLKNRYSNGLMLNLTEAKIIFLTKICIKSRDNMRLNEVFQQFELRGIFLDASSKEQVMYYYEKLNLIEKKSDSGDAQYVKRIL